SGNATGILFGPSGTSELYVSESYVTDNGTGSTGGGIVIRPSGAGNAKAVLSQVHVENNSNGIWADETVGTGLINLSITDSVSAGNSFSGIIALTSAAHGTANIMVNRATSSNNNTGVQSNGPASTVRIGSSVVSGNNNGVVTTGGGVMQSYQNN